MELTAADAIHAAAKQMELALCEYHDEVARYDDSRESGAISAFIGRVRSVPASGPAMDEHVAEFQSALRKIRQDRETEFIRRDAVRDNVEAMREVAKGVERLAIESLTLRDDMRRYLTSWMEAQRRAGSSASNNATIGINAKGVQP